MSEDLTDLWGEAPRQRVGVRGGRQYGGLEVRSGVEIERRDRPDDVGQRLRCQHLAAGDALLIELPLPFAFRMEPLESNKGSE